MTQIKLSPQTLSVLKNYSTINSSIVIRKGNQLKTISVGENSVAIYVCEEQFPQDFAIYDLSKFLSAISLFESPTLQFGNPNYVLITGGGKNMKYYFSDPEITLKSAPDREIKFPETDMEFTLSHADIISILDASSIFDMNDVKISSEKGQIILTVCDKEDDTSNTYFQTISGETTGDYEMFMKIENLRLWKPDSIPERASGSYNVKISSKLITEWKHSKLNLTYYIALEP